jgi:hypothetical protein
MDLRIIPNTHLAADDGDDENYYMEIYHFWDGKWIANG